MPGVLKIPNDCSDSQIPKFGENNFVATYRSSLWFVTPQLFSLKFCDLLYHEEF